ncbi:hypothetical protein ACCO45_008231 [Purpureocillium lilacinum]|uniref:Uncharacterized protein n=1 Tax=Purpureocillium lilacinum TaxID=33203 RepID=A0ACC4DQT7_PURLI
MSDFPVSMVPRKQMSRVPKQDHTQPQAPQASASRADDDSDSTPIPQGKGLKGRPRSSLRPISTKKRPRSQLETDSESEEAGAKKSHFFSDEDDAMDGVLSADAATNRDSAPAASSPEPIPLVIRAEKIPSTVPQGPKDTWLCDQDGCDYIVRGGDDCQARIQDHFRDHEQQLERSRPATQPSPSQEEGEAAPGPSGPSVVTDFKGYVRQFRRSPHPVADKIHGLTWSQSPARKNQAPGRQEPASPGRRHRASRSPTHQTETDSVTVTGDD